jgi:hypothetical protein
VVVVIVFVIVLVVVVKHCAEKLGQVPLVSKSVHRRMEPGTRHGPLPLMQRSHDFGASSEDAALLLGTVTTVVGAAVVIRKRA